MSRAPFQVLIIPYRMTESGVPEFAVTKRTDSGVWQFLSGGGEEGETPLQAARREAQEEGGIPGGAPLMALQSQASIPVEHFAVSKEWGTGTYVIPEYAFAVEVRQVVSLSSEHRGMAWLRYEEAVERLRWDSNRTALWELTQRLATDTRGKRGEGRR